MCKINVHTPLSSSKWEEMFVHSNFEYMLNVKGQIVAQEVFLTLKSISEDQVIKKKNVFTNLPRFSSINMQLTI